MNENDNATNFTSWKLPDFEDLTEEKQKDASSLFGKSASWYQDPSEPEIIEEEEPAPLTLEDIEEIRKAAFEDGSNEGRESGLVKGLEEGKLQGLEEGHKEGLEQGIKEGLEQGKVQIDTQVKHLQDLIVSLHEPLKKLDENVEYQLVRLATSLAEQITRSELKTNPQIILQALKQSVESLPVSEQTLKILLNPEDLDFVQSAFSDEACSKRGWDLQAEPALMRGDCQIYTKTTTVENAFSSRVEQVLKQFFNENHELIPEKNEHSNLTDNELLAKTIDQNNISEATALETKNNE